MTIRWLPLRVGLAAWGVRRSGGGELCPAMIWQLRNSAAHFHPTAQWRELSVQPAKGIEAQVITLLSLLTRRMLIISLSVMVAAGALLSAPRALADNRRLNDGVVANVYTVQRQAGCVGDVSISPQLRLAAQWHTDDVMNDRELGGELGSDGSVPQDRANAAGFRGTVAETVAINSALAISGIELMNQWYYNPAYLAIMRDCANTVMGVWSANSLDRSVVVAVYGHPA